MLIISECRKCNADKFTCPVKIELSKKLHLAGIKERLKFKCSSWYQHLKYKRGDKVEFHFIENGEFGGEISGETLIGMIVDISKKKPVYIVMIDKANRAKIDSDYSAYDRFVSPCDESGGFIYPDEDSQFFKVPVKESLIVNKCTTQP